MEIQATVKKFLIANNYLSDLEIDPDASLLESGLIDSIALANLLPMLEDKFDIQIVSEEILPENLDSLERIEKFIIKMVASKVER